VVRYYSFKKSGFLGRGPRMRGATEMTYNMPMELVQVYPGRAHVRISEQVRVRTGY